MKRISIALISVVMLSNLLSGCPTCLGSKQTMHGKSYLYHALRGMSVSKQKQLTQLVQKLNQHRLKHL